MSVLTYLPLQIINLQKGFSHSKMRYSPISFKFSQLCFFNPSGIYFVVWYAIGISSFFPKQLVKFPNIFHQISHSFLLVCNPNLLINFFFLDLKEVEMIIISNLDFIYKGEMNCCLFWMGKESVVWDKIRRLLRQSWNLL